MTPEHSPDDKDAGGMEHIVERMLKTERNEPGYERSLHDMDVDGPRHAQHEPLHHLRSGCPVAP